MVTGTVVAVFSEEWHQLLHHSLVNTESLRHAVQVVKHLKEQCTWLVNCADHCPALLRQSLHEGHALATRCTVQAAAFSTDRQ